MRYAIILLGGMVAALAGCQANGGHYNLHGKASQKTQVDQRSFDSSSNTSIDKSHDSMQER